MKRLGMILGDVITQVDERNIDGEIDNLLGVSIDKQFMPSVANVIGTDLSGYKVVKKDRFACNPMHVGRDEKLPLARFSGNSAAIVSPAYFTFEVTNSDALPRYIELWMKRPEFDRRCWFATDASVRGGLSWDALCSIEIDVPPVHEQKAIIKRFDAIEARIGHLRQINDNLAATALVYFEEQCSLHPDWTRVRLDEICQVKGGKRLPAGCDLSDEITNHPCIRVRDLNDIRCLIYSEDMAHIDDAVQSKIARYIVNTNDVVISIVGTIGLTALVDQSLDGANLTENCDRLTSFEGVPPVWIYLYLNSQGGIDAIREATVGAVQAKLPLKNIQALEIPLPDPKEMANYENLLNPILD